MARAICISCGCAKSTPWQTCKTCGFDPSAADATLTKSVYLSVGRFDDPEKQASYEKELDRIGRDLEAGKPVRYDEEDLARLLQQKRTLNNLPAVAPWGAVMRTFLPGLILLLLLAAMWLLLRLLR